VFLKSFLNLLPNIDHENPNFPPTILYNEGWLLRLDVDWFSSSGITDHPLSFPKDGHWFSEARLPSAFLPRKKGDPLAESHTNADGVIGQFMIGRKGKTDLELLSNATHFVVIEAKLFSGLSKGVKNAKYYDQAARTVACMAQILSCVDRKPKSITQLGFYVLAPSDQIESKTFTSHLDKQSINDKVKRRIKPYDRELDEWFNDWFIPTLEKIEIRSISWEAVLDTINKEDSEIGGSLFEYYSLCLRFNS
jgi:hypothetical protein